MKKLMFRPKAVIFDMDGVIVDSMPYHFLAWYEALIPYGIRVSCFEVYAREGEIWDKTLKDIFRSTGTKVTKELSREIYLSRQKIFKKIFKRVIFKGARELIARLKKDGYLIGLVTGTPDNEIRKILPADMKKMFDRIVAGNHVKKGKPHPEPYLRAASRLEVAPSECVVVENALKGIASAKKAGMFCVAITTGLPRRYMKKADIVIDRIEEVYGLLHKAADKVAADRGDV